MRITIKTEYGAVQEELRTMDFIVDPNQAHRDIHPNSLTKILQSLKQLGIRHVELDL